MQIVAAIVNYNDADFCKQLLSQVLSQGFDKVYVLDDGSTDGSQQMYKHFPGVIVVQSPHNQGLIANKNQMLKQDGGDVIFFIDADMALTSSNIAKRIKELFTQHKNMGVLGAQVIDTQNEPIIYNYHRFDPVFGGVKERLERTGPKIERYSQTLQKVAWTLEGACAIRTSVFNKLHGFDERFKRYHEGPDFCKRARKESFDTYKTTKIQVQHLRPLSQTRWRQYKDIARASAYWTKKHGFKTDKVSHQY